MESFLVQLDPKLQELIVLGLTWLVTFLILQIANVPSLKWLADYLGEYKVSIVTWAAGLIFNLIQAGLNQVPATWDSALALVMQLIVEVAAVLLAFAVLRKAGVRGLK